MVHCSSGVSKDTVSLLSCLARQLLAPYAKSEIHFSDGDRIACSDTNRLKDDAVESSVVYYKAVWKGIV